MTKRTNSKGDSAKPRKRPTHGDHQWQGEAVERARPTDEEPELAASRAEGNELMPVEEALEKAASAADPATFGLGSAGAARRSRSRPSPDDGAENVEEKRQAAAEEHAEAPPKHSPHGRL